MTRTRLTNANTPMPPDYEEMMRHYLPDAPKALIVEAWKHNATPIEVTRHIDRIEAELKENIHG